ncbi:MAG: tetratricopeptide repeat protein [Bryobacteraceae bacterium]
MSVVRDVCFATVLIFGSVAFCSDRDDLSRAYDFQRQGSLKQARGIYESVISRLRSTGDSVVLAGAIRRLSEVDLAEGKYADALHHASECAALSHKIATTAIEVDCLSVMGRAQIFSGDYPGALGTHEHALVIAKAGNSTEDQIAFLNNLGGIYFFLGRYGDAYRSYLDAQSLLRGHERESWHGRRQQLTLANLAALYQQLGQYQQALDSYSQVRAMAATMRPAEQAILMTNVGTLYRRLGDPVKAIETYRQAQQLSQPAEIAMVRSAL